MLSTPEKLDPEATFQQPDEKGIAVAVTVTSQVGTNRQMVLQTYLDRDAPIGAFHALVDKLASTANRQEAVLQLEEEQASLILEEKTLKQFVEDYYQIELRSANSWMAQGKKGDPKLSAQEKAQKVQAETSIERYKDGIAKRKERIAKYQALIAKRD